MRNYDFPHQIETLILEYAIKQDYIRELREVSSLSPIVRELSAGFTKKRKEGFSRYLLNRRARAAYLLYFLPANFPKIQAVLQELFRHPGVALQKKENLKVLDIGSGPGTALLGLTHFFLGRKDAQKELSFHLTALDHTRENLKDCQGLFALFQQHCSAKISLNLIQQDMEKELQIAGKFDYIVLSNSLNELYELDADRIQKRTLLLGRLLGQHLEPDGSLILIEPALKQTSRELLQVRDSLISQGFGLYSPCLAQAPCPALQTEREDWCHEELPWEPPSVIRTLDQGTGFIKDAVKYSYSVFRKDGINLSEALPQGNHWRVVSEMMRLKGDRRVFLCDGRQRILARRQDKHGSESNKVFDLISRGDIIGVSSFEEKGNLFCILAGHTVEKF